MIQDEWSGLEELLKKGLLATTRQEILRLIALARSEAVLREAMETEECECIEPDHVNGLMTKEQCNRCEVLAESNLLRGGHK